VSAELELKLELDPKDARSLKRKQAAASQAQSRRELSVYYDTPNGELRKSGLTLRVRSSAQGFVQTVKTAETGAGLFFRGEWETAVGSIEPHVQELESTPAGKVGSKKLRPVVRSEVERTTWRCGSAGDLLEFALDQGELQADGRKATLCELEIELLEGDPARAFAAARHLADEVPVRIGVLSKAERGFSLSEDLLSKPSKAPPVALRQDMTVAQGFAAISQSCLKHFRLNEPLIVQSRDPVALHQARVALRRLRSASSLFRPALVDTEFPRLREELRWFTGQLSWAKHATLTYCCRETFRNDLEERSSGIDRKPMTASSLRCCQSAFAC
jgi:triphosphatase